MKIKISLKGVLQSHYPKDSIEVPDEYNVQNVLDMLNISHLTSVCLINEETGSRTDHLKDGDRLIVHGLIGAG